MSQNKLNVGQIIPLKGCFTEEYFLRGLTAKQITTELGLPSNRTENGLFIAWATYAPLLPSQFELAGWTEFSTDKFTSYDPIKGPKWHRILFEQTYKDKRIPISIEQAKKAWVENMKKEKLIKVLYEGGEKGDYYPAGGKASQIIVTTPTPCQIVKFLKDGDVFHGVL